MLIKDHLKQQKLTWASALVGYKIACPTGKDVIYLSLDIDASLCTFLHSVNGAIIDLFETGTISNSVANNIYSEPSLQRQLLFPKMLSL